MSYSGAANVFGIGGRYRLAHFAKGHPIDAQSFGGGGLVPTLPSVLGSPAPGLGGPLASVTAVDADNRTPVVFAFRRIIRWVEIGDIRLEKPMPLQAATLRPKPEHRAAKCEGVDHMLAGALDVFDYPEGAIWCRLNAPPDPLDQLFSSPLCARRVPHFAVALARWRCPDEVEPVERERHRIGLVELEGIPRLGCNIDANNVKASAVQAHRCAASATEQIQCP